jgi:hypothetical protein
MGETLLQSATFCKHSPVEKTGQDKKVKNILIGPKERVALWRGKFHLARDPLPPAPNLERLQAALVTLYLARNRVTTPFLSMKDTCNYSGLRGLGIRSCKM